MKGVIKANKIFGESVIDIYITILSGSVIASIGWKVGQNLAGLIGL